MVALGITVIVASITFACYKAKWWPFSLLLPASREHFGHLKPTTTSATLARASDDKNVELNETNDPPSGTPANLSSVAATNGDAKAPDVTLRPPLTPPVQHINRTAPTKTPSFAMTGPTDSQRMPPPPVPTRSPNRVTSPTRSPLRSPPSITSSGPLPNRNPTRLASSSLAPPPNRTASLLPPPTASRAPQNTAPRTAAAGTVATSSAANPRRKVILAPGHSPLDWAALTRSAANLSGVPFPQRVTPSQLAAMNGRKGRPAWSAFQGKVYNIGPYLPFHPGGEGELKRAAGRVGDKLFMDVHPWVNWEGMMGECLVGFLVEEREGGNGAEEVGGLDGMD